MALKEIRIVNYRAFKDTGVLSFDSPAVIVGKNDAGKSAILHGLDLFFNPPKRGGISEDEIHGKDSRLLVEIEVAFDPIKLANHFVKLDAKNIANLLEENLLDSKGLLRFKMELSTKSVSALEILINDYDDPDIFGMAAIKKEEDLIEILKKKGLKAIPAGKETNAEKRKSIREYCSSKNIPLKESWLKLDDKEKAFKEILPIFLFFTDDSQYNIDETPVQNQFKTIVDKVFRTLPINTQVKDEADNVLNEEFGKLYKHLSSLTDTIAGVKAEANVDWKKAISGIDLTWLDAYGTNVPYELRGAGIRRLFMVAYFQYEATEGLLDGTGPKYVFAIEEPEVHLHPGAQRTLIAAFEQLSSNGHSVIFATHSPVFASVSPPESLILVRRVEKAASAKQFPEIDLADVAIELGVEASDRLIGKNHVVLVEGKSDADFFEQALIELNRTSHIGFDPSLISFIQCGGIGNLKYMATTQKIDEVGLEWGVIADSDRETPGGSTAKWLNTISTDPSQSCKFFIVLERTCLENYMDSDVINSVVGVNANVPFCGPLTYVDTGLELNDSDKKKIKDNAREICIAMGSEKILSNSLPLGESNPDNSELLSIANTIWEKFSLSILSMEP